MTFDGIFQAFVTCKRGTCKCFIWPSSRGANLWTIEVSIYFLQRRSVLKPLTDGLAGRDFSQCQKSKGCQSYFITQFFHLHPGKEQMVSSGSILLAGKHPFDWDAHSFTRLKKLWAESKQCRKEKHWSKAKLHLATYAKSYRPSGRFMLRFLCKSKKAPGLKVKSYFCSKQSSYNLCSYCVWRQDLNKD